MSRDFHEVRSASKFKWLEFLIKCSSFVTALDLLFSRFVSFSVTNEIRE